MSTRDISYFVRYEGKAENQEAFLAHYRDRHSLILARFALVPDEVRNVTC